MFVQVIPKLFVLLGLVDDGESAVRAQTFPVGILPGLAIRAEEEALLADQHEIMGT